MHSSSLPPSKPTAPSVKNQDADHVYPSKELGKEVSYNFTIASGGSLAAPISAVDTIAGLDEFGDVADPVLASATQPSVAIKVLDKRHNAIYTWSLDRMQQQLLRMRNLTTYIDRPSYTKHFSSDEPFYDLAPPAYSFIGNATVSLIPLFRRLSSSSTVPIFCRYTAEAIGSCRVEVNLVNVVAPTLKLDGTSNPPTRAPSPGPSALPVSSKINVSIIVDSVKGLSSHDFSTVHMQLRLSSIIGTTLKAEEIFFSPAVDIDSSSLSEVKFHRRITIGATSKVIAHLRQAYVPIEFFAATKPMYLERMERWDELRESKPFSPTPASSSMTTEGDASMATTITQESRVPQAMRRSETDFVVRQNHDVVAWLQVCELAVDGQYAPVPVIAQSSMDPGAFSLHQGIQRRIVLTLTSSSGQQLPWLEVTKMRMGNVRLLDPKGRIHVSPSKGLVNLPLMKDQILEFLPDGTGKLVATAPWDSSVHDSELLNRVTAVNYRVLLQMTWAVAVETCADPVQFNMDIAITIQTRDASPPSKLMTFFGSSKIFPKTSTLFNVQLSPPLTRSPKDLWRLDTSEKYVRGEEVLNTWKPRGISIVEDYERLVITERRASDVQATRVILQNLGGFQSHTQSQTLQTEALDWRAEELLQMALKLWQMQLGHRGKVSIFL